MMATTKTTCSKCGGPKTGKHGSYCLGCSAAAARLYRSRHQEEFNARMATYTKEWHARNPGKKAEYKRKANYGMTADEFNTLMDLQGGLCAICSVEMTQVGRSLDSLAVDHDHETGKVRGLLCSGCNVGLGYFRNDPDIMVEAAAYMMRHIQSQVSNEETR